jgi:hypothetical protein
VNSRVRTPAAVAAAKLEADRRSCSIKEVVDRDMGRPIIGCVSHRFPKPDEEGSSAKTHVETSKASLNGNVILAKARARAEDDCRSAPCHGFAALSLTVTPRRPFVRCSVILARLASMSAAVACTSARTQSGSSVRGWRCRIHGSRVRLGGEATALASGELEA